MDCPKVYTVPPADPLAKWKDQTRTELLNMVAKLKQALKEEIVSTMQSAKNKLNVPDVSIPCPARIGMTRGSPFVYTVDKLDIFDVTVPSGRQVNPL